MEFINTTNKGEINPNVEIANELVLSDKDTYDNSRDVDYYNQQLVLLNRYKLSCERGKSILPFPIKTKTDPECNVIRVESLDNQMAAGYNSGDIVVYDLNNLKCLNLLKYLKEDSEIECSSAICSLRWKPHKSKVEKNVLLSVNIDGEIIYWHSQTGKLLHKIEEKNVVLLSLDYNKEGSLFAVGGGDHSVRIYDENMKVMSHKIPPGSSFSAGHTARINSICFHKNDNSGNYENIIASGGWDQKIILFDIRQKKAIHTFTGPCIAGDSIDLKDDLLLSGSYSGRQGLQLWDLRTFKLYRDVETEVDRSILTVKFSKSKNEEAMLAYGSAYSNTVKVFKISKNGETYPYITSKVLDRACYTLDFSNNGKFLVYSGPDSQIRVIDL